MPAVLVIGFGNPGRGDDGLGPALAEAVRARALPGVEVCVDYQLAIEHAADVAAADTVVFVDATVDPAAAPYSLSALLPDPGIDFTTHALAPGRVLALAQELFGARPRAWILAIAGARFEPFEEELSASARVHLDRALEEILPLLTGRADVP